MFRFITVSIFISFSIPSFSELPLCGIRSEEYRHTGGTLAFRLSIDGKVQKMIYFRLSEVLTERDRMIKAGHCSLEPGDVCVMQVNPASSYTYQVMSEAERWSERYFDVSDAMTMQKVLVGSKVCSLLHNKSSCQLIEEFDPENGSKFSVYREQELLAPPFLAIEDAENFLKLVRGRFGLCQ